jgi:hypothetical protein
MGKAARVRPGDVQLSIIAASQEVETERTTAQGWATQTASKTPILTDKIGAVILCSNCKTTAGTTVVQGQPGKT